MIMLTVTIFLVFKFVWLFKYQKGVKWLIKNYQDTCETVSLNNTSITFATAKETIITTWESVTQVKLTETYITLYVAREYHILPLSAMTKQNFEELGNYLKHKMGYDNVEIVQC